MTAAAVLVTILMSLGSVCLLGFLLELSVRALCMLLGIPPPHVFVDVLGIFLGSRW